MGLDDSIIFLGCSSSIAGTMISSLISTLFLGSIFILIEVVESLAFVKEVVLSVSSFEIL